MDDSFLKGLHSVLCIISNRDGMLEWKAPGYRELWYLVTVFYLILWYLVTCVLSQEAVWLSIYLVQCFQIVLFVCLGFCFGPLENFFTHMETYDMETINGEELQTLTYAWHSWPLSSECSLACRNYCDTGHPSMMVFSEDPWHSHLLPSVQQWTCH